VDITVIWGTYKTHIAEMDKRVKELETGMVNGLKIEELSARARQANKKEYLHKEYRK
jgi:hypothetical protein